MKKVLMMAVALGAMMTMAEDLPVNLGFFENAQIAYVEDDVSGFELGLFWDRSHDMKGLALAGGGNIANGRLMGVSLALGFNWVDEGGFGGTGALGFNRIGGTFGGIQWCYGANICHGDYYGLQESISNYANVLHGVQLGWVNMSHEARGLQVGLINTAEVLSGVQVGILNFIRESPLPFFPIVNAYF